MEVEIEFQGTLADDVVNYMFKRGIADALEVSIEYVVELKVSEIALGGGLRRLQSVQAKRYVVSYTILLPESVDADVVVAKANRIAMTSSAESQVFQQALTATKGVAQVRYIKSKKPAHKIGNGTTSTSPHSQAEQDQNETLQMSLAIGGTTIFMALLCFVASILIKRRSAWWKALASQGAEGDSEAGGTMYRVPSTNTLLDGNRTIEGLASKAVKRKGSFSTSSERETPVAVLDVEEAEPGLDKRTH